MTRTLRDSVRAWRRTPGVAAIAVISLALAIGSITTFFAIVERLLLQTLDVPAPHQLVALNSEAEPIAARFTYPVWEQVRTRAHLFDSAFAWHTRPQNLAPTGETDMAQVVWASGGVFRTLRVEPAVGRFFNERDDVRSGGPDGLVAVVSYGFWLRRFGGSLDVVGRTVTVERIPFTIVGVAPRSLSGLAIGSTFDVMLPLMTEPSVRGEYSLLNSGRVSFLRVMIRSTDGRGPEWLTSALRADQDAIRDATIAALRRPGERDGFLKSPLVATPAPGGSAGLATYYARSATLALSIGALVLVACCGNVATVLVAHANRRQRELSVRMALGASRWETARQLLFDSLLVSGLGACGGLGLALWTAPRLVSQWGEAGLSGVMDGGLNIRVWSFAAAAGVVTGLASGAAAAWRASRADARQALAARSSHHRAPERVQAAIVTVQLAFSFVVVVTSVLVLRSYLGVITSPALANLEGVTVAELRLAASQVPPADRPAAVDRVREALATIPRVDTAVATTAPFHGGGYFWTIDRDGLPPSESAARLALLNAVSPSYFGVVGARLVSGRLFSERDVAGAPRVAVINQAFARKYLGGELRVPQQIGAGTGVDRLDLDVVGVVEDVPDESLSVSPEPALYVPRSQGPVDDANVQLLLRSTAGAAQALEPIRRVITSAAPELSFQLVSIPQLARGQYTREKVLALVAGFFVALTVLLAGLGVLGVVGTSVAARRRELGVRLALGALPVTIAAMVVARAARIVGAGLALGLVASWWARSLVSSLLVEFESQSHGLMIAASAALSLFIVGLVAAWWPARQAARLDPAEVLRAE